MRCNEPDYLRLLETPQCGTLCALHIMCKDIGYGQRLGAQRCRNGHVEGDAMWTRLLPTAAHSCRSNEANERWTGTPDEGVVSRSVRARRPLRDNRCVRVEEAGMRPGTQVLGHRKRHLRRHDILEQRRLQHAQQARRRRATCAASGRVLRWRSSHHPAARRRTISAVTAPLPAPMSSSHPLAPLCRRSSRETCSKEPAVGVGDR